MAIIVGSVSKLRTEPSASMGAAGKARRRGGASASSRRRNAASGVQDVLSDGRGFETEPSSIKGVPSLRNIPPVMLTALDDEKSMIEGIDAGADDCVAKSADSGVLEASRSSSTSASTRAMRRPREAS